MSEKIVAGKVDEFKEGVMREVAAGEREIFVVRLGEAWYAADARCPHQQFRLSQGTIEGTVVVCPLHGSKFDLKDGSVVNWIGMSGIALKTAKLTGMPKSINVYKVEIEDGSVMVEI